MTALRPLAALLLTVAISASTGCFSLLPKLNNDTTINRRRLDRALKSNPGNVHAHFIRGRALLESSDEKGAIKEFESVIRLNPDFEEAYEGVGIALMDQQKFQKARDAYAKMAAKFPRSAPAQEGIAGAELAMGNLTRAEEAAKAALAIDARSGAASRILGEVAYTNGDYAGAIAAWESAIEFDGTLAPELRPMVSDLKDFVGKYK